MRQDHLTKEWFQSRWTITRARKEGQQPGDIEPNTVKQKGSCRCRISDAEYHATVRDLRTEWEVRAPNPGDARGRYLQEGWERDEIDGHPLIYGSVIGNWLVRKRLTVHGLSAAAAG